MVVNGVDIGAWNIALILSKSVSMRTRKPSIRTCTLCWFRLAWESYCTDFVRISTRRTFN